MKYLTLLLFGVGMAFSQSSAPSGMVIVSSDPTGVACVTNTSKARLYHGSIYTCQSNLYALSAGGGGGAPSGAAGGDLSGTYPNPTVAKVNGVVLSGTFKNAVTDYSCVGDGTTDNSTCINNALTAMATAGGVLYFPPGTYKVNSQIVLPNDGATSPIYRQASIRLTGAGPSWNGLGGTTTPKGGSILDLRYSGNATIATYGTGYLEIDHLTLANLSHTGTLASPFILTTNTTLNIHDDEFFGDSTLGGTANIQDAIVLGGGDNSTSNTVTSAFGGYGTIIKNNFLDYIRRMVYAVSGNSFTVNAIQIVGNSVWFHCGSNDLSNGAALEFASPGGLGHADGNYIAGNLFEGTYVWMVRCALCQFNTFVGNSAFDTTKTATYRFDSSTSDYGNLIVGYSGTGDVSAAAIMSDPGNRNTVMTASTYGTTWSAPWTFTSMFSSSATNVMKMVKFGALLWSNSTTDPTTTTGFRLTPWDSTTFTLDTGTIRSFLDWRVGHAYQMRPVTSKGSNYSVSATDDHNTVFTNTSTSGEVDFTLPASPTVGTTFTFYVDLAQIVKVVGNTSQTINLNGTVSGAAGNTTCAVSGCAVTLTYITTNKWVATSVIGTWTTT